MKLMTKLLLGFIGIACIVLIAGVVGVITARSVGQNADYILDEKVPIKDVSMEAIISVIAGRDASGEYLLNTEGLDEIGGEINESIEDFDMWIAMVKYGTGSSEFKNSAAGEMYIDDGLDIVVQKGTPEMISLANQADEHHEVFSENAVSLINARNEELNSYDALDKEMSIFDLKFSEIDEALEEYEVTHESWEDKDAAMEARIILGKQKALGEEYTGLSVKDIRTQTELKGEFDSLISDYLLESEIFPPDLKEKYDLFSGAAVEMFVKKDEALDNWEYTHNYMTALDEASSQTELVLEDLETMADEEMVVAMEQADKAQQQGFMFLIITIIAGVVLAVVIGIFLSKGIMKQIGGEPRFIVSITEKVANGDLTVNLSSGNKSATGVTAAVKKMVGNLRNMVQQILDGSSEIASSSEEMSASAQQLSEGAQSQASTLEETSAAVEELSASVEQVSDHAQAQTSAVEQSISNMGQVQSSIDEVSKTLDSVSKIAKESVEKSKSGAETVKKAVDAINLISASSEEIAGIINVISDIADQTNLLALNASIEAARAGEHGRGFAVVADEVSKLADRSASSTKEIETLIKDTVKNVKEGVELAQGSSTSMEEITEGAQKSSDMIDDLAAALEQQVNAVKELSGAVENINEMSQSISAATEEQTNNSKQTSKAIEDVNEITQQAASAAEEMAASTEELSGMAQQLQSLVSQFKLDDTNKGQSSMALPEPGKDGTAEVKGGSVQEVTGITLKEEAA
jgi:methyl-accepting chemotaxis protein